MSTLLSEQLLPSIDTSQGAVPVAIAQFLLAPHAARQTRPMAPMSFHDKAQRVEDAVLLERALVLVVGSESGFALSDVRALIDPCASALKPAQVQRAWVRALGAAAPSDEVSLTPSAVAHVILDLQRLAKFSSPAFVGDVYSALRAAYGSCPPPAPAPVAPSPGVASPVVDGELEGLGIGEAAPPRAPSPETDRLSQVPQQAEIAASVATQCRPETTSCGVQVDMIHEDRLALPGKHRHKRRQLWATASPPPGPSCPDSPVLAEEQPPQPEDGRAALVQSAATVEHQAHLLLELKRRLVQERLDVLDRREAEILAHTAVPNTPRTHLSPAGGMPVAVRALPTAMPRPAVRRVPPEPVVPHAMSSVAVHPGGPTSNGRTAQWARGGSASVNSSERVRPDGTGRHTATWGRAHSGGAAALAGPSPPTVFDDVVAPGDWATTHVLQHQFLPNRRAGA